jgi:hypothetical protein
MADIKNFRKYIKENLPSEVLDKMATDNYLANRNRPIIGRDKPLNVKPLVEKVVYEITNDIKDSTWLLWKSDGSVRVRIGEIIPETYQQTTIGRRKRFRKELMERMLEQGWIEGKEYNVYQKAIT